MLQINQKISIAYCFNFSDDNLAILIESKGAATGRLLFIIFT